MGVYPEDEGPWTDVDEYPYGSFGLGAVIDQLTVAGAVVHILCYTHGGASTLNQAQADLHRARETELRQAAAELGAAGVTLLDYPDGGLAGTPAAELVGHAASAAARVGAGGVLVFGSAGSDSGGLRCCTPARSRPPPTSVRPRPRQGGSPQVFDGVQLAGQPGPQVLPEQRAAGPGERAGRGQDPGLACRLAQPGGAGVGQVACDRAESAEELGPGRRHRYPCHGRSRSPAGSAKAAASGFSGRISHCGRRVPSGETWPAGRARASHSR